MLGAPEIMRTIQRQVADKQYLTNSWTAGHVMNYVNLDKHGLELIVSSETVPEKSPELFSDNNNWIHVLFLRDTYLFLPKIPLSLCQTQTYLLRMRLTVEGEKPQRRKIQT